LLENGDIVVARTGNSTGENYIFTGDEETVYASYLIRFKIDRHRANPFYVWYNMRSTAWWGFIEASKTGSAQAGANAKVLSLFPFKLPDRKSQDAIANILKTLDEKIELNRQMNATLETMAQALFKSWFVDFDPVIDNALAAGNPIPEPLHARAETRKVLGDKRKPLPDEIQKQFPSNFVFSEEMGWVPEGWEFQPVYDVAKFINGAAFKNFSFSDEPDSLPVVKIAEIKNGITGQTKFTNSQLDNKYLIENGEILFSWSGNPDTSIDTFIWDKGRGWLNQHIFKVSLHKESDRCFVYYLLKSLKPIFTEIARDKQTTGLGHVTAADMKRLRVLKPRQNLLDAFNSISIPVLDKWYENSIQSNHLERLRDTLLPKLLSGQLSIPDYETMLEQVAAG
jgi:type I restriction enzyme S subunit